MRHTFAVQPGCTLKIDSYRGSINVTESDESVVTVSIHMEIGGDTDAAAQRVLAGLQLNVAEENNTVSIFARNPRETRARWIWRENEQIDLVYRIAVPRRCHVDLRAVNGSITVGRLEGRMLARLETGNIFFRGVEGSVDAATDFGDVVISRCTGDVVVKTLRGLIRTGTVGGAADLKNSSGDIEIMTVKGPVKARAEAGGLTVGFPRTIGGDAELVSSGGGISVRLDPVSACRIEASAAWGKVSCDLPVKVESGGIGRSRLHAQLNQGGPSLKLRASGGGVAIAAGEAPFE